MKRFLALSALAFGLMSQPTIADNMSPEGTWKTIDDETGKPKSLVQIWIDNGELNGKIIELIEPEEENPKCTECEGDMKDQPILGMQFIWGLKEDDGVWDDGEILDPKSGSVYSSKIEVTDGGQKLDVRGYVGFAFAGRSQVWHRVEEANPVASEAEAQPAAQAVATESTVN
jgi:uncharacterized protein (DUF2147 family)